MKAKAEAQYNEMMEKIQASRRAEEALVNALKCHCHPNNLCVAPRHGSAEQGPGTS